MRLQARGTRDTTKNRNASEGHCSFAGRDFIDKNGRRPTCRKMGGCINYALFQHHDFVFAPFSCLSLLTLRPILQPVGNTAHGWVVPPMHFVSISVETFRLTEDVVMKRFALFLFALVAALPSTVQAQYPPNGYYYNPQPVYRYPYPYYPQGQYPNYGYYYGQPAPQYPPNYPVYPAMPAYPQAQAMPASPPVSWPAPAQVAQQPVYPAMPAYPQPQAMPVPPSPIQQASAQVALQSAPAPSVARMQSAPDPVPEPEPTPQRAVPAAPERFSATPVVPVTPTPSVADVPAPLLPPAVPTTKEVTPVVKVSAPKESLTTPKESVTTPKQSVTTPKEAVSTQKETVPAPKEAGTLGTAAMESTTNIFGESCPTPNKCHYMVFAEYLYWTVHGADVPYAQAFDGVDPVLSVPRGEVGVASPQYQSGFKVGGGVSLGNGWLVGTFTYFDMDRGSSLAAGPGDVLHNFMVFPNTVNAAGDSLTAVANYHIQLYMVDLDYKCPIINNDHLSLNWVAGIRYAHLDQNFSDTFQITGTTTINSTISFDGIGPRIGLEGEYKICGGFYGYCHGLFDVLFGEFRGNYGERNVFTGVVGQTSVMEDRAVPILELEVGAGWQSCDGRFRFSAGYYVGAWFNVMTTTSLQSGIGNANYTTNGNNFRDNITFDGFVAKFEFRF
jgi:hypothetical protein